MRIGALADATGVTAKTLRYYEAEGLLPAPARAANGYRVYPPEAGERVRFIRQAQAAGLTLRQIGEVLAVRDAGRPPCRHVADLVAARLDVVERRLRELADTRAQLLGLRQRLAALDPADCTADSICSAVTSG
jgi:DNA-binding transcriptional MerR regulator